MSAKIVLQSITTILLAIIACSLLLLLGEKMGVVHFGKKHAVTAHVQEKNAHQHQAGCDEKEHGTKEHKPAHDHKEEHKDDHKADKEHGHKH